MTANEREFLAEVRELRTHLEAAEAENRRWLKRERCWTKLEEKLQLEVDKLAEELDTLCRQGDGGSRAEETVSQAIDKTDRHPLSIGSESKTDAEPFAASESTMDGASIAPVG